MGEVRKAELGEMIDLLDRFQGCLVGLAVGDALGGPLEFLIPAEIRERHGGYVRDMVGGGWLHLRPGEYTDDTQMMLCLAESIVEQGNFDMDDVARRFLAWYDSDPKDVGNTTRTALAELKRGVPWQQSGKRAYDILSSQGAGNGSLMRCAPVGLFHYQHRERLIQDSVDSSRITHWDPRACYSAVALNLAIAELLAGNREGLLAAVSNALQQAEPEVHRTLLGVENKTRGQLRSTGYVINTLDVALWCFLKMPSFEDALVAVVNLGGDADTAGAVCGALAGAHYGLSGIPARWLETLENRDHIAELAAGIYALTQK